VFAVMLIERVTVGAMTRGRVPYVINYVKRPYPFSFALFVVGIVCRAATPIGVVLLLTELWGQFP
jgi:hypothetical protein